MVMTVNMHEAKTNFSKLAKVVESGEQVFVARNGKVIMKMAPLGPEEWANYKNQIAESFLDKEWN